jgi:hypothetical protein
METYRLHLKIGVHEFSAEGPVEVVQRDFELWKSLILEQPAQPVQSAQIDRTEKPSQATNQPSKEQLEKVYLADEKQDMLSLRILPRSDDRNADAMLLVIFGYKTVKGVDQTMVTQLKSALRQSGCMVDRIDQAAAKYVRQGFLNKGGMGKGGRYSLTNLGAEKAAALVSDLASS